MGGEDDVKDTDPSFRCEEIVLAFACAAHTGRHATGPDREAHVEPGILANLRPVRARASPGESRDTAGRWGADAQERTPRDACGVDAAEKSPQPRGHRRCGERR